MRHAIAVGAIGTLVWLSANLPALGAIRTSSWVVDAQSASRSVRGLDLPSILLGAVITSGSSGDLLVGNTATNASNGFQLGDSDGNTLSDNLAFNNRASGFALTGGSDRSGTVYRSPVQDGRRH